METAKAHRTGHMRILPTSFGKGKSPVVIAAEYMAYSFSGPERVPGAGRLRGVVSRKAKL
jgi:hypothetical protein